jgi:uroporphyrinogen decarboxylase
MTSRERWLALFERRPTDRLACDYWGTPEFHAKLRAKTGTDSDDALWQKLSIDRPRTIGPVYRPSRPPPAGVDMWGVRRQVVAHGTGSYSEAVDPPLAGVDSVQQIHEYPWPSPDDMDYSVIESALDCDDRSRIVMCGWYEPFLLYCAMRGMERAFEDLLLNPDIADAALQHIFDYKVEECRRSWVAGNGRIDMMYLAEDLGGQTGPLFSLQCYREFLLPRQKKMADLAKSFGIRVFYHTDGSARPFLPDLVDVVGIDLLNPLQWRCPGMELQALVRDFADRLVFHGGIDNQHTLPFGSTDDVRQQVREVSRIMEGARWICAPCHNIQSLTPVDNVLAMYDELHRLDLRQ